MLFHNWGIEGTRAHRTMTGDLEWTFPPEIVELVWGDGTTTNRQIISATGMAPFGNINSKYLSMWPARSGSASLLGIRAATDRLGSQYI